MADILLRIIYLCTIGCCLYTSGWLLMRAGRNKTTWSLAGCQILVMIWCVPLLFTGFLTTTSMKYLAYGISYVGISFIGPAWLEFSFHYCGKKMENWKRAVLLGISIFNYAMFLSNEAHSLFYRQFTLEEVAYGPVFYFHMIYTYVCVLWGMSVVLLEFKKRKVATVHMVLILLSAAVPLGFNLLYLSGIVKTNFDLTPPAFACSSFLMLLAVFRYDFLDVNAMAFEQLFASMAEGVIVYNRKGKLTYCNEAAGKWLETAQGDDFRQVKERLERLGLSIEMEDDRASWKNGGPGVNIQPPEVSLENGTRLQVKQYIYRGNGGQMAAGAMILTDVSQYYELLRQSQELEVSGRRLAVEQERNRIAQEVHDTTGHTLTMIQSLLRLMKAELKGLEKRPGDVDSSVPEKAYEYIDQAQELVTGGIRELRCSINQMRQEHREMTVTQGVYQLAESVKEMEVETVIQGEESPEYTYLSPVVYSILREAITNCLKYARASHMDVILKFEKDNLSLFIFDDGQGCGHIQENNGLGGIRERVTRFGGTVRFLSSEGEGFQIYVNLPVAGTDSLTSESQ